MTRLGLYFPNIPDWLQWSPQWGFSGSGKGTDRTRETEQAGVWSTDPGIQEYLHALPVCKAQYSTQLKPGEVYAVNLSTELIITGSQPDSEIVKAIHQCL